MPFKKGQPAWNKGISNTGFKKGYTPWNKGLDGYTNSGSFINGHKSTKPMLGKKHSKETRLKMSIVQII